MSVRHQFKIISNQNRHSWPPPTAKWFGMAMVSGHSWACLFQLMLDGAWCSWTSSQFAWHYTPVNGHLAYYYFNRQSVSNYNFLDCTLDSLKVVILSFCLNKLCPPTTQEDTKHLWGERQSLCGDLQVFVWPPCVSCSCRVGWRWGKAKSQVRPICGRIWQAIYQDTTCYVGLRVGFHHNTPAGYREWEIKHCFKNQEIYSSLCLARLCQQSCQQWSRQATHDCLSTWKHCSAILRN